MNSRTITRRGFVRSSAAFGAFLILPSGLVRGYAATERVNVAIIGAGGQGTLNRRDLAAAGANIAALCDVDERTLGDASKEHPEAERWIDFREMLQKQKNIDAVMVSTTDHVHYPASMMAIKLGKHVCTEKPLTHSVWEARALGEAAKAYKVATQLDNEGHSSEGIRLIVEWIRAGAIGKVREVHIWSDRPSWPQGIARRPASKSSPSHLHWDLWIGPAPYRDYHDHLHAFQWRGWWDFGTGALGDMGCHFWDSALWALDLGHPTTIKAEHEGNSSETGPNWSIVTYQFPARSVDLPAVTVKWYDGGRQPPRPEELEADRKMPSNGSLFVGDTGKILVNDVASARIIPEAKMREFKRPAPSIPRVRGHKNDWLDAIRTGRPATANFTDVGGPLTELVLLGNVAIRSGKMLDWDGPRLLARNAPEASQYVRREYRKGWDV